MNILTISYGRHLFNKEQYERYRMEMCAKEVGELHMIIFSLKKHNLHEVRDGNLVLHPTHSRARFLIPFDAIRLGVRIVKSSDWWITTQDAFETGFVGLVIRSVTGARLNVQEHGDFFSAPYWRKEKLSNTLRYYFGLWLLRRADSVRVVAERTRTTLVKKEVDKKKIEKLPVCIPTTQFEKAEPVDHGYPITLISVARPVPQKNLFMLLEAFASIAKVHPDVHLILVNPGEKKVRAQFDTFITDHNLQERVTHMSWSDNVAGLMKGADIYVHTAHYEGWGRVFLEAMLAGIPSVTTDVGAVGEVLKDGVHGYVVPLDDRVMFEEKLQKLIADRDLQKRMGEAAKQDVRSALMDEKEYARRWAEVFQ